jgi:hypothetical protein
VRQTGAGCFEARKERPKRQHTNGLVTLRLTAEDTAGNAMTQTVRGTFGHA